MSDDDLIRRGDALRLMPSDTTEQEGLRQAIAAIPAAQPTVQDAARVLLACKTVRAMDAAGKHLDLAATIRAFAEGGGE